MESLRNNKPMLYSLSISGSAIIALASGLVPEATEYFELVHLPDEVSLQPLLQYVTCLFIKSLRVLLYYKTKISFIELDTFYS